MHPPKPPKMSDLKFKHMKLKLVIILIAVASVARAQNKPKNDTDIHLGWQVGAPTYWDSVFSKIEILQLRDSIKSLLDIYIDTENFTSEILFNYGNPFNSNNIISMYREAGKKYFDDIDVYIDGRHYYIKLNGYVDYIIDDKGIKTDCVNNK